MRRRRTLVRKWRRKMSEIRKYICECDDPGCRDHVLLTVAEYMDLSAKGQVVRPSCMTRMICTTQVRVVAENREVGYAVVVTRRTKNLPGIAP